MRCPAFPASEFEDALRHVPTIRGKVLFERGLDTTTPAPPRTIKGRSGFSLPICCSEIVVQHSCEAASRNATRRWPAAERSTRTSG